jgi:hypothetical protein
MKMHALSSNRRSRAEIGCATKIRPGLIRWVSKSSSGGWTGAAQRCTAAGRGDLQRSGTAAEGKNDPGGDPSSLKDVKNEGRSGNVYENKGPCDILPDTKDDICAWLHAILHKITRILQKPTVFEQYSSAKERTHCFEWDKLLATVSDPGQSRAGCPHPRLKSLNGGKEIQHARQRSCR